MGAAGTLPLLTGRAWSQQPTTPYRVGAFSVEPLFDGSFPLMPEMIPGADSEEGHALLRQAGLPPSGPSPEPVNAFLIRRGERIWLLDAGCGMRDAIRAGPRQSACIASQKGHRA